MAERGRGWVVIMPGLFVGTLERWNSPYINHFISADTVVSSYANPQTLNRYSYVSNNPLRYIDPTGHSMSTGCGDDGKAACPHGNGNTPGNAGNCSGSSCHGNGGGDDEDEDDETNNPDACDPVLGCENPDAGVFCDSAGCWYDASVDIGGTYQDPAVYISLAFGGWGSGIFSTSFGAAATACVSNPICVAITGMAGGAPTTVTQTFGSNPNSGVTVLGYTEDLSYYEGVEVNMLQNVPNYSWEGTNVPFLDQAMERGDTIVLVSDFAQYPLRTFPQEVIYLQDYPNVIDLYHPQ